MDEDDLIQLVLDTARQIASEPGAAMRFIEEMLDVIEENYGR